ncbi:MAG: gamma-glutamyltransferase, partial [Chloroflexota bacterium]
MSFEGSAFCSRRSNVMAQDGMVASSQPLAVQAGLEALRAGGNAVDAAVATAAALCVVEPCSTGIGGDAFALIWQADEGRLYGLNASGPAPAGLTADLLRRRGYETMPDRGGLSVTVPGALRGWQLVLDRFGSLGLDRLMERAIAYAEDGFPVSELIARSWQASEGLLGWQEASRRVWLLGGRAPRAGELFRNPALAGTLRAVAGQGVDVFYQGPLAAQVAETVQAAGGVLAEDDLAAYRAEWVEPIWAEVGPGQRVYEIPPNGQ